jgi:purine-nucleoside phosphorylase
MSAAAKRSLAFIAGSGMDPIATAMTVQRVTRFDQIAGVGAPGVEGHTGRVLEGTIGGGECTLVMGRRHVYEGAPAAVAHLVEWLAERGVTDLVMASAAGALHSGLAAGDLVVAHDIVDFQNRERLVRLAGSTTRGVSAERLLIDGGLAAAIERAATNARVSWQRGVIVCGVGPAYETQAEVRALQEWGDAATMSSAPELAAASRLGVRAAAVAVITNPCTGIASARPSHTEVLEAGRKMAAGLAGVIRQLIIE